MNWEQTSIVTYPHHPRIKVNQVAVHCQNRQCFVLKQIKQIGINKHPSDKNEFEIIFVDITYQFYC